VSAKILPLSKVFVPIPEGFKEYNPKNFSFVQGKATAIDGEKKIVTVAVSGSKETKSLPYSTLILATGSVYANQLWYIDGEEEVLKNAYREIQVALENASTILVAGGGAVGVETAGEIGYHLKKKVVLLSGNSRLLIKHNSGNSSSAESQLKSLGVETIHNVKVISSRKVGATQTELTLNDGTSRTVDVYIDATGPKPNSQFLPPAWLGKSGHVVVDDKSFRVVGVPGVYAFGDLASSSDGGVQTVMFGTKSLGSSIAVDLAKEFAVKSPLAQKDFSMMKDSQFVSIGPNGGVGQVMGWRIPSFLVKVAKSKGLFLETVPGRVTGNEYKKP
jgi:NADH dehydrogenase FAD-containing subunit